MRIVVFPQVGERSRSGVQSPAEPVGSVSGEL
jgi:hypothetical protein